MPATIEVKAEGLNRQMAKLAMADAEVKKMMKKSLGSGLKVVRSEVLPHVPVYSGRLKGSFRSSVKPHNGFWQGRFYNRHSFYLRMVDAGRTAGAPMPFSQGIPERLTAWVIDKFSPAASELRNVVFNVARAIGRKGIKGRPIMEPAWLRSKARVLQVFANGVRAITEMLSNRGGGGGEDA